MGSRGSGSGKSKNKYGSLSGGKVLNLHSDDSENSKTMKNIIKNSNTIMYHTKTNLVEFYKQEGLVGTAKNVDKMNMRRVAKNLGKQYIEV